LGLDTYPLNLDGEVSKEKAQAKAILIARITAKEILDSLNLIS